MENATSVQVFKQEKQEKQQPVQRFMAGDVQIAIWANVSWGGGIVHRATISKRYKRKDGTWSSSSSFSKVDLVHLMRALQQAAEEMLD